MQDFDRHERRMWSGDGVPAAYLRGFAGLCAGAVPALLDRVAAGPGLRLLDVGTGTGSVAAAALALGATVTAVDGEPQMVKVAAERLPEVPVSHALLPGLPFADREFDAVTANFVVNHVADPVAALAELRRVVRPGGRGAVTLWHGGANRAMDLFGEVLDAVAVERPLFPSVPVAFERTPEGLAGLLTEAGWQQVEAAELSWTYRVDPEDWWAGPAGGVANIGLVVSTQPESVLAALKRAYDRLVADRLDADGRLVLEACAVLASGVRGPAGVRVVGGLPGTQVFG
ncbi:MULTISPECIES: class I SAM-dependent methyltransferase [unclassified Kitasatospora]|uniref:class I SAM-dependent methyltransferase n=1 Tax=unclassified Kitasatospora TaxID=2633591 RepID=UPI0007C79E7E|nr:MULTISPECIES: class I SAM-dependent methyltransferase [unclassified Kitasatospora]